jgi:hypothetical protein
MYFPTGDAVERSALLYTKVKTWMVFKVTLFIESEVTVTLHLVEPVRATLTLNPISKEVSRVTASIPMMELYTDAPA